MKDLSRTTVVSALLFGAVEVHGHTLTVAEDSQTNSAVPSQGGGALETVYVRQAATGAIFNGFVRFELSSLPPGAAVLKATLRLWVDTVSKSGSVEVHPVLGLWQESTLTAALAPPIGPRLGAAAIADADRGRYVLVDVTTTVQSWLSGVDNNGFALVGADGVAVKFDSKENTVTSHPMEIELAVAGPAGPPGEPGAPGPPGPPADLSGIQALIDALAARVAALEQSLAKSLLPLAPTAEEFMWQGQQVKFQQPGTGECQGHVALGVGDQAVCYAATDGSLKCAGRIYASNFGPTFMPVPGPTNVEQVLVSSTVNSIDGNAVCLRQADNTAWCMGSHNDWGQFGNGSTGPSPSFVQWGASGLVAIGTGTWDQLCALDTAGDVHCAGNGFGLTPVVQGGPGPHSSFWVTTFGGVAIDDMQVWRAAESRTECRITASGLVCPFDVPLGPAGQVVMGGNVQRLPDDPFFPPPPNPGPGCSLLGAACWLTSAGSVQCARCDEPSGGTLTTLTRNYFSGASVVAIGANFYGNNLCAVYSDGSLWCLGDNASGMLGTGDMAPRTSPTMVQAAGSVRIDCH